MIYLDNAATTFPKPRGVPEAVNRALTQFGANPGRSAHRLSLRAAHEVWRCRERLAAFFNAPDPARIAFCLNCTDALNMAIQGSLRPGMHVITTALEHNSVLRQLAPLRRAGDISLTILPPDESGTVSAARFAQAMTRETGLVICTHASNVTGAIQPVGEIAALCRARGVRFVVDMAQTAGLLPIDLQAIGCDLAALPGHKGLYGPMGTGALCVAPGVELRPLRRGGTGSSSQSVYQPDELPDSLESGTLNLPGIAGLDAGIAFIAGHAAEVRGVERELLSRLLEGLAGLGARILGPQDVNGRVGVVSFNLGSTPSTDIADALSGDDDSGCIAVRAGLHCAPLAHEHYGTLEQGAVRISLGAFNTLQDVEAALRALERFAV